MDMAFCANLLIIFLELIGLRLSYRHVGKWMVIYYTEISNFLSLIASILFVLGMDASVWRYLSTCMLCLTFLVSLLVLSPQGGLKETMLVGECLYHHTLIPVLSLVSYVFWEGHSGLWHVPVLITVFYGLLMIFLNLIGKIEGPYEFLMIKRNGAKATFIWTILLIIVILLVSSGIMWISGS